MARIPEFTRRRLASSAVGVPQRDVSSEIVGEAATRGASQITGALMHAEAQRADSLATIEANKLYSEYTAQLGAASMKVKEENAAKPSGATESMYKVGNDLATNQLRQATNDLVRRKLSNLQQMSIRNNIGSMNSWARGQEIMNGQSDLQATANTTALQATQFGGIEDLDAALTAFAKGTETSAIVMYGKKADQFQKESAKSITEGFYNGKLEKDPVLLKSYLDQGVFNEIYTSDEIKKKKADTLKAISGFNDKQKFALDASYSAENIETISDLATLTPGEVQMQRVAAEEKAEDLGIPFSEEQGRIYDKALNISLEAADIGAENDPAEFAKITSMWMEIKKKDSKVSSSNTLESLLRMESAAYDGVEKKLITPKTAGSYVGKMLKQTQSKIREERGGMLTPFKDDSLHVGFRQIYDSLKSKGAADDMKLKGEYLLDFIEEYDKRTKGGEVSMSEADAKTLANNVVTRAEAEKANIDLDSLSDKGEVREILDGPNKGRSFTIFKDGTREWVK